MKYEHLFFDWDHTLWDFESNSKATLQQLFDFFLLRERGLPAFNAFFDVYSSYNKALWTKYQLGKISRDDLKWKRMRLALGRFGLFDEALAKEMSALYLESLPLQGKLMPHTLEVLDYCQSKGYQMHLITNGFHETQLKKIKSSAVDRYFQHIITSEHCNSLKPHSAIFDYALQVTGAHKMNSVMIGDNLDADISGARDFGMAQIFYNPESVAHHLNPTFEVRCLRELKNVL